ncbi:MAG: FMN-binding protein [Erysipelotrichaceae bacterium]|jgi:Na+-translocating ferredoxin:NAD+ oxidoreductase RnfG subunit|nr:FMN-binding protein [Erysipelotrichaceae bacterium]
MKKNRTFYLAGFLAVISMVAGLLLWFVNDLTYDRIQEGKIAAEKSNLEKIFPGASFAEVDFTDDTGLIEKVFEAKDTGYIYKINVKGYKDTITFMLGIKNSGEMTGYEVLSISDTPGIGMQVAEDAFKNSIIGKASNDGIATISGATISSSAVINGIKAAQADFNARFGISGEGKEPEPEPSVVLGAKVAINDASIDRYKGEITENTDTEYVVKVKGYGLVDDDGSHGLSYDYNIIRVTIDPETNTITAVAFDSFGDTSGIGSKANVPEYLDLFKGLSLDDTSVEVDTVSGATCTSKSIISAIRIVMDAAGK